MKYRVDFTPAAAKQVEKLTRQIQIRVLAEVEKLSFNPQPIGVKRLRGEKTAWRIRIGDYRVVYDILDDVLTVTVLRIAHRSKVYSKPF